MRFKAVLVGALLKPYGKGDPGPWQVFAPTQEECEAQGKLVLAKLTDEQRKTAYVRIAELSERLCAEVHTAKELGPDGELRFAIAREQ